MNFAGRITLALAFIASVVVFELPADAQSPSPSPMAPMARSSPMPPQHFPITPALLAGLPRTTVTVTEEHGGGTATYGGVALSAILARENVPQGKALRGAMLGQVAVVVASDGYRVAFAFPELDPAFTDRVVLLADTRNGAPLDPKIGPYRIVVPDEKREARWIHNAIEIDIATAQ
jgi:hypothetical protein